MDKIVFATTNEGKVKEIKEILAGFPIEVVSMNEYYCRYRGKWGYI